MFRFDWDPKKATSNKNKHGIAFEQAITVWDDPEFLEIYDASHSQTENRYIRVGRADDGVMVVVYTERENHIHRIISARKASRKERRSYDEAKRKN
jgi:uncharacterized protein